VYTATFAGGTWTATVTASPVPITRSGLEPGFTDLACSSATRCQAGWRTRSDSDADSFLATYTRGRWTFRVVSPEDSTSQGDTGANGIACTTASCWLVGSYASTDGSVQALVANSSGTAITAAAAAEAPADADNTYLALNDIACAPGGVCFAVGTYEATLTEAPPLIVQLPALS
jgi:hypothetical protein